MSYITSTYSVVLPNNVSNNLISIVEDRTTFTSSAVVESKSNILSTSIINLHKSINGNNSTSISSNFNTYTDFSLVADDTIKSSNFTHTTQSIEAPTVNVSGTIESKFYVGSPYSSIGYNFIYDTPKISASGSLVQIDDLGPLLTNITPPPNTYLVDPYSSINFSIIDNATTPILVNSLNIFINGNQYVTSGAPSFSGSFVSLISPRELSFLYQNSIGFDLGSTVLISGTVKDSLNNINNFQYSYRVWDQNSLLCTITPIPDIQAPYLAYSYPPNNSINIDTNTLINIKILDDLTGVSLDSLKIFSGQELIVSGIVNSFNGEYNYTVSPDNRELNMTLKPYTEFNFNEVVTIKVQVNDRNIIPNSMDQTIQFTIQDNSTLQVGNFNILQDGTFIPFNIEEVKDSKSPTQMFVDFFSTNGKPIDVSNSKVIENGNVVNTEFTSLSGNTAYRAYFSLEPNYNTFSLLNFFIKEKNLNTTLQYGHSDLNAVIEPRDSKSLDSIAASIDIVSILDDLLGYVRPIINSTELSALVYGSAYRITNTYSSKVLWGYEVCANDLQLNRETLNTLDFFIKNKGCKVKESILTNTFNTVPYSSSNLRATIEPKAYSHGHLLAVLESSNPFFEYGKVMNLRVEASDYTGNKLSYEWSFKIEEK